jgi:outer membrane protein
MKRTLKFKPIIIAVMLISSILGTNATGVTHGNGLQSEFADSLVVNFTDTTRSQNLAAANSTRQNHTFIGGPPSSDAANSTRQNHTFIGGPPSSDAANSTRQNHTFIGGPPSSDAANSTRQSRSNSLSLNDALQAALKYNHQIRSAQIQKETASKSVTRGNAGQLPEIGFATEISGSLNELEIQPGSLFPSIGAASPGASAPGSQEFSGVTGSVVSARLGATYVVYDGGQGAIRFKLLQSGSTMAQMNHRLRVEQTILEVTALYYRAVMLQNVLLMRSMALEQSSDRYKITSMRAEYGQASEQEYLQALVDLKTDSTSWRETLLDLETALSRLHQVIGWDWFDFTTLDTTIQEHHTPPKEELYRLMMADNAHGLLAAERLSQSILNVHLTKAATLPKISSQASYGYTRQYASDGLFERQEQLGISGGVSVQIPLFTGGRSRTAVHQAQAARQREEIHQQEVTRNLQSTLDQLWREKIFLEESIRISIAGLSTYERNYERAKDAFERGLLGGVELRAAQIALQDARLRVEASKVEQALNGTRLLHLGGLLIKESYAD